MTRKTKYPLRAGFKRVTGLFAFWTYDTFPYVLGGPVMSMNDSGRIQAETYGGSVFVPLKILPRAVGEAILTKIEALRREQHAAEEKFRDEWREKIRVLVPEVRSVRRAPGKPGHVQTGADSCSCGELWGHR